MVNLVKTNWKARFIFKFKQVSATFIRTSRTYCILRGLCLECDGGISRRKHVSNSNEYVGKVVPSLSRRKHVSSSNEYVGKVVPSLSRRKHVSNSNEYVRKVVPSLNRRKITTSVV